MSLLSIVPEAANTAASELDKLGSYLQNANGAAASQTTAIAAPAADEVSAAITALFGTNAQEFQKISTQAAAFHHEFVSLLSGGAGQYLTTEVANAEQILANSPAQALLGHSLLGPGTASANPADTTSIPTPVGNLVVWTGPDGASYTLYGPFGTWGLSGIGTGLILGTGTDGPTGGTINAFSPFGYTQFGIQGNVSGGGTIVNYTSGSLHVPSVVPIIAALQGPNITGAASVLNSTTTFVSALGSGDVSGAAKAFLLAPFNYTDAVLFGHQTITVGLGGDYLNFPFGGVFASPEPVTVTFQQQTFDVSGEIPYTQEAAYFPLQGTQFGGIVPAPPGSVGISL